MNKGLKTRLLRLERQVDVEIEAARQQNLYDVFDAIRISDEDWSGPEPLRDRG